MRGRKERHKREREILSMFFFPPLPLFDSLLNDYTTLAFIALLLLLSILSLCFIFHLRFKSRTLYHLQDFNSLWSVRFILVAFIIFWALNELLRIPFYCRRFLYPLLPSLNISNQASLCKIHVVLSLGFFEPAFLVTLLFLLNISIKQKAKRESWAFPFVLISCFPILTFQVVSMFLVPLEEKLPSIFTRSYVVLKDGFGNENVVCGYPLLSTIAFGSFCIAYCLCFLFSCWKAVSLAINKSLRVRIYVLAFSVLTSLAVQILSLGLSSFWSPEELAYGAVALVVFISTFLCAAMGEGMLVIRPIADALAAGGECCRWIPASRSRPVEDDQKPAECQLV